MPAQLHHRSAWLAHVRAGRCGCGTARPWCAPGTELWRAVCATMVAGEFMRCAPPGQQDVLTVTT